MHRTTTACLGAALFILPSLACSGDDSGDAEPTSVGMTFSPTSAADGSNTPDDDDDTTAGDDGGTTASMMDTAADSGTGADPTGGPMTGSSDDGPPAPPTCQHQCTVPADCLLDGEETAFLCNGGLCSIACVDDAQCIATFSGWDLLDCTGDGDCEGGRCIDRGGGVGGCALQPSQGPCEDANLVQTTVPAIGGGMATVCGQPGALCALFGAANQCILGCASNGCLGDLECQADGICHCDFDTECVDAGTGNNCNAAGLCEFTCTAPGDCPAPPWDGGTLVCQ